MPFKSFRDFDIISELQETDLLVGYRELAKEFQTPLGNITTFLSKNVVSAPNVLYVHLSGSDTNTGESEASAFRTIKRAAAKALWMSRAKLTPQQLAIESNKFGLLSKQVNIFIRSGDYEEDNPIYLPPGVTMIGDNLRSVTIIPKNKFYDIIWVNNRCYVWGFTFRQHKYPSYAVAYPKFQYLSNAPVGQLTPGAGPDDATPATPYYNTSTRIKEATARTTEFYTNFGDNLPPVPYINYERIFYKTTKLEGINPKILNLDTGYPAPGQDAITPFQVAFLSRYFRNVDKAEFFTEAENDFAIEFWNTDWFKRYVRRPYTLTSPYPQGNSSITRASLEGADDAGGGVLVDGEDVDGPLRSMVMDSYTQFNEGGKGNHIINNGYAQLVSTFTICCTEGVICESGGTCSINTSNCSFGLSGLVAKGKSPRPTLVGNLGVDLRLLTNQILVTNLGDPGNNSQQDPAFKLEVQPYPGQCFEIVDKTQVSLTTGDYLSANNSGSFFSILTASPLFRIPGPVGDELGLCSVIELETNYSPQDDLSVINSTLNPTPTQIFSGPNTNIYFYIRSTITTSAHTMEYIGTGSVLLSAIPQNGGQTFVQNEVCQDEVGRVFFTATNQFGDFRIGQGLTIVQATGTIEGDTFRRSILQTITPFTIAISN